MAGGGAKGSAIDPSRYASFSLTHVRYDAEDPLAKLLALITLAPIFLLSAYTVIILYRRELVFLNALVGQLGCEAVNWALKRLIKQPRPPGLSGVSEEGFGMPSSHSQFMGFFAAYFVMHFVLHHPPPRKPRTLINTMRRIEHLLSIIAIVVLSLAVCFSRHYLLYHSTAQILVGASIGLAIGFIYYYLTEYLSRRPVRLPAALASPASVSSPRMGGAPLTRTRKGVAGRVLMEDDGVSSSSSTTLNASESDSLLRKRSDGTSAGQGQRQGLAPSPHLTHPHPTPPPPGAPPSSSSSSALDRLLSLQPSIPLRQIILDHPLSIAFRLRDSWSVWPDGGIEADYAHWRSEWERRRPS